MTIYAYFIKDGKLRAYEDISKYTLDEVSQVQAFGVGVGREMIISQLGIAVCGGFTDIQGQWHRCSKFLGLRKGLKAGEISHGVCEVCEKQMRAVCATVKGG